jgi:hypothetical protein
VSDRSDRRPAAQGRVQGGRRPVGLVEAADVGAGRDDLVDAAPEHARRIVGVLVDGLRCGAGQGRPHYPAAR